MTDEPALTHHYHLGSMADIMVHSSCCTFCGLGHASIIMISYGLFHCRKNPLGSTYSQVDETLHEFACILVLTFSVLF